MNFTKTDSVRPSCPECVYKHLSEALILGEEYLTQDMDGTRPYLDHFLYMYGNLGQAEAQSKRDYPEMAQAIRSLRLRCNENKHSGLPPRFHVPTVEDISEILALGGMAIDGTELEWEEWNEEEEDSPTVLEEPIAAFIPAIGDEPTETTMLVIPPVTLDADDLYDKASVSYTQKGEGDSICQNCEAWQGLEGDSRVSGRCLVVAGKIFKNASCDLFSKKK